LSTLLPVPSNHNSPPQLMVQAMVGNRSNNHNSSIGRDKRHRTLVQEQHLIINLHRPPHHLP
jgi:hypothetical protein